MLMFSSGLVTANKLSSAERGFEVVWKGKEFAEPQRCRRVCTGCTGSPVLVILEHLGSEGTRR